MKKFLYVFCLSSAILVNTFEWACGQPILAAIVTADLPRYNMAHQAMVEVLQAGGFNEDKLKVFKQTPNADKMSLANSLRRAEAAGASLVVTYGSRAADLARTELKSTPFLFADVYDPVALGAVKTLEAPGTDASGATSKTDLAFLVEALMAIKPLQNVGVLFTQGERGSEQQLNELKKLGELHGFAILSKNCRNHKESITNAEALLSQTDALFLTESIVTTQHAREILGLAHATKRVVFSQIPGLVQAGALIGLEASPEEQGKLVAVHVLQVLQGQKAHILPVRQAKQIVLKVNQQKANELGLTIPPEVASKAKLM